MAEYSLLGRKMATIRIKGIINWKLTRRQKSFNPIASKYMKFKTNRIKRLIQQFIHMVGEFNVTFSVNDRLETAKDWMLVLPGVDMLKPNSQGMVVKMIPRRWLTRNAWVVVWECVFYLLMWMLVQLPGVEIQQAKQARLWRPGWKVLTGGLGKTALLFSSSL